VSSLILVDTSIFIDFFRTSGSSNDAFKSLLEDGKVALSPFVRLEILSGMKVRERGQIAGLLDALDVLAIDMNLFHSAELLLPIVRRGGLNAGLVDYFIVIQALSAGMRLFTRDKVMVKLARLLKADLLDN
jgi:predicted nucleic acid-binding protein